MSGALPIPVSSSEVHLDRYFGQWILGKVGPLWQGATESYKGGAVVLFGTSRQDVLDKISEFAKTHERLIATDDLADKVMMASGVALGVGALTAGVVAIPAYSRGEAIPRGGATTVGAVLSILGVLGFGATYFIRQAAEKNRSGT